ncbi:MAG: tyrosine-type recombinase/integrase [Clostridium sp.]|uniref:site-specific tyrosine recombinase/integron integrase n=1 Tax=Clostridium sp. TaxID=1506 RepID=UPI002FC7B602
MENIINNIKLEMIGILNNSQMDALNKVLVKNLYSVSNSCKEEKNYCNLFLCAKQIEGCSEKSIKYYKSTIEKMIKDLNKPVTNIITEDLRGYLGEYYKKNSCSKVTIDNIRRILSSFFSWLEDENYILKSPIRRIGKIKTGTIIREVYTDEQIEVIRDKCDQIRDLALVDLLNSTGIRVGELVKLNIDDINFNERECIVEGKGNKQRKVYFDAKTKIHLQKYIDSRSDNNNALFVSLLKPHRRLMISGVEIRLRNIGTSINVSKVHPHKFRRTLATRAIDKGMPIEQVQHLLGHKKIDTTLQYAMINETNVKISHRKYIG